MIKGIYKNGVNWVKQEDEYLLDQNPATGSSWAKYVRSGHTVQWVLSEKPVAGSLLSYTGDVVIDGKRMSKKDSIGVIENSGGIARRKEEKGGVNMAQTKVEVRRLNRTEHGSTRAFADIETPEFVIKGYRVVEGRDGLFVSDPSQPSDDGKWYKQAYAKTDELKDAISAAILEAYNQESASK